MKDIRLDKADKWCRDMLELYSMGVCNDTDIIVAHAEYEHLKTITILNFKRMLTGLAPIVENFN
jgi:hypothetical protein